MWSGLFREALAILGLTFIYSQRALACVSLLLSELLVYVTLWLLKVFCLHVLMCIHEHAWCPQKSEGVGALALDLDDCEKPRECCPLKEQ